MGFLETSIVAGMIGLLVLDRLGGKKKSQRSSGKKRPISREAKKIATRARRDDDSDLARRLERGEIRGGDLRALFESGAVRTKRNPAESEQLATARRLAREFHGTDSGVVLELDPDERRASRYAVVVGEVPAIEYQPPAQSKRAGAVYRHESGDRGPGQPEAHERPLLAVDPVTRRPIIVQHKSPMKFSSKKGLVG